ncbi:MAG: NAD(+)/NADH kinase [Thermoplasmata archaeon]
MSIRVGVYGTRFNEKIKKILNKLEENPLIDTLMFHKIAAEMLGKTPYSFAEISSAELDFVMAFGGDGTILRLLQNTDKKILGVNTGRLGFLTSIDVEKVEYALRNYADGDYLLDERIKIKAILNGEEIIECTNEAVVHTDKVAKIREFVVYQGESRVERFRADGVIVSTPTGSTCYSMSSGGPILHPSVDAFVLVPISPFKLSTKPYVVPVNQDIRVILTEKDKSCLLVLDGQREIQVDHKDDIRFALGDTLAKFIVFDKDFYARVAKKLVSR